MIRFKDFIESSRPFAPQKEIRAAASARTSTSKTTLKDLRIRFTDAALTSTGKVTEQFENCEMLLIFDAKKQRTWLLATNQALYCIIDHIEEPEPKRKWRIKKDEIYLEGEGLILQIRTEENNETTGKIIINDKYPRLFNYRLFSDFSIEQRVKSMLMKAFDVSIDACPERSPKF